MKITSSNQTINAGAPPVKWAHWVTALLPLHQRFHLRGQSVKLLKFADDTVVTSLIHSGDSGESAYRQED